MGAEVAAEMIGFVCALALAGFIVWKAIDYIVDRTSDKEE